MIRLSTSTHAKGLKLIPARYRNEFLERFSGPDAVTDPSLFEEDYEVGFVHSVGDVCLALVLFKNQGQARFIRMFTVDGQPYLSADGMLRAEIAH